ncbi:MAG: hypothetical protein IH591_00355, partial [Bacteroidales bacterium]|nr:hypothetical protein [Bacteroidales bacterium]
MKQANRNYLRKVFTVKSLFYPFMMLLVKTGLASLCESCVTRIISLFGIKKSARYFTKYRRYAHLFRNNFGREVKTGDTILFPMMFGVSSNFTLMNLLFAKWFGGNENLTPLFYICDSVFEICTKDGMLKSRDKYPWFCHECWKGFEYIENKSGIETVRMSSLTSDSRVAVQ